MLSGPDQVLSTLAAAYGSADRARVALDASLGRAALDAVPSAPGELASFLRTDLHAIIAADVGPIIADAVRQELLSLVGYADHQEARRPLEQPALRPTVRAMPQQRPPTLEADPPAVQPPPRDGVSVMLVRVESAEETERLDLGDLAERVLRVRHPLPACERSAGAC